MTAKKASSLPIYPHLDFEQHLWSAGILRVAGLDEAGRGAWAGPVCAAAVILPPDKSIQKNLQGVRDSKQMTPNQRSAWAVKIREFALTCGVGFASNDEIDRIGILPATRLAMQRALKLLNSQPQYLLLDYMLLRFYELPQTSLVKGDRQSLSIAAASVLAKTSRDSLMIELDSKYCGYGFARHKGYGTRQHRESLELHGVIEIHRHSFSPMKDMLNFEKVIH